VPRTFTRFAGGDSLPAITLRGVGAFGSNVVFAKPVEDDGMGFLRRLVPTLAAELAARDVPMFEEAGREWTPHATLFKASRSSGGGGRGGRGGGAAAGERGDGAAPSGVLPAAELAARYGDRDLGRSVIARIELNAMGGPTDATGYYGTVAAVDVAR